jgi:hypothetical protein
VDLFEHVEFNGLSIMVNSVLCGHLRGFAYSGGLGFMMLMLQIIHMHCSCFSFFLEG